MRRPLKIVAGLLLVLALGAIAGTSDRVRWRARLVAFKAQGSLPLVAWSDLLRYMVSRWGQGAPRLTGFVKAAERGGEPCPVRWETPLGLFWGRSTDGDELHLLLKEQLFSRIYQRPPVVIRKGDVVLDVGGHLGVFSRLALTKGARLVVAFEPEPTNITCFKQTFHDEIAAGRVILVGAAAWDTPGKLTFRPPVTNSGSGSTVAGQGEDSSLTVPATTIDETVQRLKLDRVDFIKMDIEGAERYALRGARGTLSRFGPRMAICTYHTSDDPVVIRQVILQAKPSYKVFASRDQAYFY